MPTVDVHQHLWPESLLDVLTRRRRPPRLDGSTLELPGEPPQEIDVTSHRLEARLELLDRHEIDVAVVSLPPTLGRGALDEDEWAELVDAYERGILELATASDRIVPLAAGRSSDGFPGACASAAELLDLDAFAPQLDALERQEKLLFVHPGPSPAREPAPHWWSAVVEHTAQMQAAYAIWLDEGVERWPRLDLVFAILAGGGPFQLERLQSRGVSGRGVLHETIFFETASYGRRALELCLTTFGVGQILLGSDAPGLDPDLALDAVRVFGDAVTDTVCNKNPSRLLGLGA